MPFGAPPPPYTVGQAFPTENPRWTWDGEKWVSVAGQLVTATLPLPMVNTDQILVLRNVSGVQTAYMMSASDMQSYMGGTPAATKPDAMTALQWDLDPITGGLRFTINSLPANGGSDINSLQYRLNGGAWTAFSAATTGTYDITGLPATLHTAEVRAVNAVAPGDPSDTKSETPAASGGGGSNPAITDSTRAGPTGWSTTIPITQPPSMGNNEQLVLLTFGAQALDSTTSGGTFHDITPASWVSAGHGVGLYISDVFATPPGDFTITFSGSGINKAAVFSVGGGLLTTAALGHGTDTTGYAAGARDHAYTTSQPYSLAAGYVNFTAGPVTDVAGADGTHEWSLAAASGYNHAFAAVRAAAGGYAASIGPDADSGSEFGWVEIGAS